MAAPARVRIWDLPTRLFHWLFAAAVTFAWTSGQFGGSDWREWHFRAGYTIVALLLFRLAWGFAGPRYARFASFPPRLRGLLAGWRDPLPAAGHSVRGAWSVYAMLGSAVLQVGTGLFATDGSYSEGPLARFVSNQVVDSLTRVHVINRWLLAALVLLHLAAVAYYALVRRDPLVAAMLHGDRTGIDAMPADDGVAVRLRAAVLAAIAAALAAWVASLAW